MPSGNTFEYKAKDSLPIYKKKITIIQPKVKEKMILLLKIMKKVRNF